MKRGFGLIEVLVAAVVLGFLLVGLNTLQKGNREAVIRIRSRDAAQIIAQDFLDSLSKLGLSSIPGTVAEPGTITKTKDYEWDGNNGGIIAKIPYTIEAVVTVDPISSTLDTSNFLKNNEHITAKNVNLIVRWPFKNSTQSISMSRIIK